MGSFLSRGMEETMNKQFEKQVEMQKIMLERQIENMNWQREQQMAMQIARAQDMFQYWAVFYGIAVAGCSMGFLKSRKPQLLAPLVPLAFPTAYFWDMGYGLKMMRIREGAWHILNDDPQLIALPKGNPTIEDLDRRRVLKKGF